MTISKESPYIKTKIKNEGLLLEPDNHGHDIGKNPLSMDINLIKGAGHRDLPLAKIIRKKCLDCCGFEAGEVRKCVCVTCPLWPYRMGKSPFLADKRGNQKTPKEK